MNVPFSGPQDFGEAVFGGFVLDATPLGPAYMLITGRDTVTGDDAGALGRTAAGVDLALTLLPWFRAVGKGLGNRGFRRAFVATVGTGTVLGVTNDADGGPISKVVRASLPAIRRDVRQVNRAVLRQSVRFLRTEDVHNPLVRRAIVEAGFMGTVAPNTATLTRFRKLFHDPISGTLRRQKRFSGRLGDVQTRVATVIEARKLEAAGFDVLFEHWTRRHAVDIVAIDTVTGQFLDVVQLARWNRPWKEEIAKSFKITRDLGAPVRFVITG